MPVLVFVGFFSLNIHAVEVNRRTFLGGAAATTTSLSSFSNKALPAVCSDTVLETRVAAIRNLWVSHSWFREFRNSPFDYGVIQSINRLKPEIGHDWPRYKKYKEWEGTQKWEDVLRGMEERAEMLLRYVAHTEFRLAKRLNLPVEQVAEEVNELLVNQLNWHGTPELSPRKFASLGEKFVETFLAEIEADYPFMAQYARACLAYVSPYDQMKKEMSENSEGEANESDLKMRETDQNLAAARAQIISLLKKKAGPCLEELLPARVGADFNDLPTESIPSRTPRLSPTPQTAARPSLQP